MDTWYADNNMREDSVFDNEVSFELYKIIEF